jgi:hypothetical protein
MKVWFAADQQVDDSTPLPEQTPNLFTGSVGGVPPIDWAKAAVHDGQTETVRPDKNDPEAICG